MPFLDMPVEVFDELVTVMKKKLKEKKLCRNYTEQ